VLCQAISAIVFERVADSVAPVFIRWSYPAFRADTVIKLKTGAV
jgi:hypothetical protein